MMGTDRDNFNYPNYTYISFPNVTEIYYSSSVSSHSPSDEFFKKYIFIFLIFGAVIIIFGTMGNGAVIWLLGFRVKRNPFITYILNLAVADLGVLLSLIVYVPSYTLFGDFKKIVMVLFRLFLLMYSASQFFVTAISIDRCVAVFFPLWYQFKRAPNLTTIVCALIWVLSILLTAISLTLRILNTTETALKYYQFIANAVLCLPAMTIATLCFFIKFCFKAKRYRRGRLLTIILLALLFFLLFGFPMNVIYIVCDHKYMPLYGYFVLDLLACLNSSVNPVIYFLVARQRKSSHSESMKTMLQKVFKEEETSTAETAAEIQV